MSKSNEPILHHCETCEKSVRGRYAYERICYDVSWLRMLLLGGRIVKCKHTCARWALDKKRFGNGR